jgi:hypothetical protein
MNETRPSPVKRVLRDAGLPAFLALLSLSTSILANPKDDVVVLKNGDHMTGEIKSLQYGILSFKADYMVDSVRLDWKRVSRLESKGHFIVTLTSGALYTGFLGLKSAAQSQPGSFIIRVGAETVTASQDDVIRILPSETSFLQQLNGSIDFGFGYTSANGQYQSQLAATANYRRGSHYVIGSTNFNFSGQSGGNKTARYNFDLQYRRLFRERWFAGGLVDFLRDEHQSLDLRTTTGLLAGRGLIVTDRTYFSVASGIVATHERYSPNVVPRGSPTNAEALVGLDFHTFRFKTLDITSRFVVFPSITVPGRVRMDLDSGVRIEIIKDFYWSLTLFDNFDSKPPVNARRNDLGISSSFGWKF